MSEEDKSLFQLDYEAVQAEKRDRINARLQVWSLLVALIGGFGLASLQSGNVSYVVALYPLIAACVARYTGHSEMVIDQIKAYLLSVGSDYEQYNKSHPFKSSGGHKKALRDALIITEALATALITLRLFDHQVLAWTVFIVEMGAIILTWEFLGERKQ